jgi:hypothetical protein
MVVFRPGTPQHDTWHSSDLISTWPRHCGQVATLRKQMGPGASSSMSALMVLCSNGMQLAGALDLPANTPLQQTKPRRILSALNDHACGFAAERQGR